MNEFARGDVVQLKSGGPAMTIDLIDESKGEIGLLCLWFDACLHLNTWSFRADSLKPFVLEEENREE
jgi:uncharacterized protein YodC (DUF2158 family)